MFAIIGGTGFSEFKQLSDCTAESVTTAYGVTYLQRGLLAGSPVLFLPRHGHPPRFPPHQINYRANIQALTDLQVEGILAINAVGSVDVSLPVPAIVIPDQVIDYTWGRVQTFHDDEIHHVDFTFPFDAMLRQGLIEAARHHGAIRDRGVYGCTQGPRLETAAEIIRLRNDGCDVVGMTVMPEAALAREREIPYTSLCVVVNAGAGINNKPVALDEIQGAMDIGMAQVAEILTGFVTGVCGRV